MMMNSGRWMLPVLLTMVTSVGCAPSEPQTDAQTDTQADASAINQVREREISLVGTGDINKLLTVYTSDVVVMPPNEPAVTGHDAVRKWGEAMFGQATITGRYTSSQVTVSGDWAADRYVGVLTVTPKAGGSPAEEKIKGVHIMKRQPNGAWLIAVDIWNTDAPPPPSPAPPAKK
jgi:ketosteroid isomerase-like protein